MHKFLTTLLITLFFLCSCSSTQEGTPPEADATIIITSSMTFSPLTLTVPSGATLAILNENDSPHTITSQSDIDAFDNSGQFDTIIPSGSSNTFTLPDAPSGTIYYYYCRFHEGAMATPTGIIEIE